MPDATIRRALYAGLVVCVSVSSMAQAQIRPRQTYSDWLLPNPPSEGFSDANSRFHPSNNPIAGPGEVDPWYFYSWQFGFVNGDGGYIGIQKDPGLPPASKKAIFSIWGANAANCSPVEGAICQPFSGEGEGYQTLIPYNWVAGHRFRVRVREVRSDSGGHWWKGDITDLTTGVTKMIGEIRVPLSYQRLRAWSVNWVEWYGPEADTCGQLPESTVYFAPPRANNGAVVAGPPANHLGEWGFDCPSTIKMYGDWVRHHNGGRRRAFADVPLSHWAWLWIEELYAARVTAGCGTNPRVYCPSAGITRQQMAVYLLKARFGRNYTPPPATGFFADVPASSPFAPWVEDLVNRGFATGCGTAPPRFCPQQPVTRQQMAVLLLRTRFGSGYTPPQATGKFADVPVSSPFARWVEDLSNRGITSGCASSPPRFCPLAAASRASMAVFVVETFRLGVP